MQLRNFSYKPELRPQGFMRTIGNRIHSLSGGQDKVKACLPWVPSIGWQTL